MNFFAKADGINQDDLEKMIINLVQMRDKNGLLLALQPADVFQPWFLEAARPKLADDAPDFLKETHRRIWGST